MLRATTAATIAREIPPSLPAASRPRDGAAKARHVSRRGPPACRSRSGRPASSARFKKWLCRRAKSDLRAAL